MKSEATGIIKQDHELDEFDDNNNNNDKGCKNIQRWCRRIGAQQQRLHEMVRLRSQFAQLLKDSGLLDSKSTEFDENPSKTQHFKNLNYARRSARMKSKRRRLLTLQDNVSSAISLRHCISSVPKEFDSQSLGRISDPHSIYFRYYH